MMVHSLIRKETNTIRILASAWTADPEERGIKTTKEEQQIKSTSKNYLSFEWCCQLIHAYVRWDATAATESMYRFPPKSSNRSPLRRSHTKRPPNFIWSISLRSASIICILQYAFRCHYSAFGQHFSASAKHRPVSLHAIRSLLSINTVRLVVFPQFHRRNSWTVNTFMRRPMFSRWICLQKSARDLNECLCASTNRAITVKWNTTRIYMIKSAVIVLRQEIHKTPSAQNGKLILPASLSIISHLANTQHRTE